MHEAVRFNQAQATPTGTLGAEDLTAVTTLDAKVVELQNMARAERLLGSERWPRRNELPHSGGMHRLAVYVTQNEKERTNKVSSIPLQN